MTVMMRLTLLGATLLAAACSAEGDTVPHPTLGETVRHNMAVHALPVPLSPTGAQYDMPGRRADVLMERYMTGKVKQPTAGSARSTTVTGTN